MKKILKTLLLTLILSFSAFIFTACDFFQDEHQHEWGAWTTVTSPDCYNKGLEKRVCKLDASHVDQREVAEKHNGSFICSDCYRPIVQEISSDFYVNLATSSLTTPLAFVVNDISVTLVDEGVSLQRTIDFAELSIYLDEQNKLCGYGYGETAQIVEAQGQRVEVFSEIRLVIDGEQVYLHEITTQDEKIYDEFYKLGEGILTQLLEQAFEQDVIKYYQDLIEWFDQDGKTQIQNFLQTNKAFINSYLALVTNGFLTSTPTQNGYELNLNWQGLKDANEFLYSKTIEQALQEVLGEQPLTVIRQKLNELLEITVGEMVDLVEEKTGNTMEEVIDTLWVYFDLPDTIKGVSKEYLKQNICGPAVANVTVGALVEDYINAGNDYDSRVSLQLVLDELFEGLQDMIGYTPYQLLVMAVNDADQTQANQDATILYNTINAFADEMQDLATLKVNTDKKGNILGVRYVCDVDMPQFIQNIEQQIQQQLGIEIEERIAIDVEIKIDHTPQKNYALIKGTIDNKIEKVIDGVELFEEQLTELDVVIEEPLPIYIIQTEYRNGAKYYQAKLDVNSNDFLTITFNENMQIVEAKISRYVFNGYETIALTVPQ